MMLSDSYKPARCARMEPRWQAHDKPNPRASPARVLGEFPRPLTYALDRNFAGSAGRSVHVVGIAIRVKAFGSRLATDREFPDSP
jgi:hypothetical protein